MALCCAAVCIISCIIHTLRLIRNGNPVDYSHSIGNLGPAIKYAYTGAMSPAKKESAYLHLPTYTAGLLYHMATFLSLFLFIVFLIGIKITGIFSYIFLAVLLIGGISGTGILIKRMVVSQLRYLSNPDDYISNLLVTLIQFATAAIIVFPEISIWYYLLVSLLFLYLPLGKLKHTVYFFAARYHLGFFYGWRGVWPPKS